MDRFQIGTLRSYYGALLTKRQNETLRLRYDEDMSLGEIAVELGVSRQTVLDALTKGEKHLSDAENALGLVARDRQIYAQLDILRDIAESAEDMTALAAITRINEILEG